MPKINASGSGHSGPAPLPGGHQYLAYSNATYVHTLKRAMDIIQHKITAHKPCNEAFKQLPGGRTLAQIWVDPNVWINFDPSSKHGDYGATRGKDITITAFSLRMGHWTVAATLVHELAHVNGASGSTHAAEATLSSCLLSNLEDPNIIGQVARASIYRIA